MPRHVVTIFLFVIKVPFCWQWNPLSVAVILLLFFLPPMFFHSIFSSHKVCVTDRLNAGTEFKAVICVFTAS